ncbi:hypothetical protein D477_018374 [Arthrobacter crystallopoietes BAB-32]|uniref:Heavy metal-binding domain-containing protein n=1 Tax=Arthrobacter crystallopoietes BAB-32 TaxID=1246476 RepID=N1UQV4_9MICC|nr:hypothetical protein [Arthrobacter crystallopoietes]EMY32776.1 hypothetical protein D477_018374 [Arthrobacter crystallopoietes BAB-32]
MAIRTQLKLGLYGAGLAALFTGALFTAQAVMPADAAGDWAKAAEESMMKTTQHTAVGAAPAAAEHGQRGLSLEAGGFMLEEVTAPGVPGEAGILAFRIIDRDGQPLTDYELSHEKNLHLIVVRTDGTQFRHVHPTLDADGTWSVPWEWADAGSYRIFADFVPAGTGEPITLTRTVDVAGEVRPGRSAAAAEAHVAGYTVSVQGSLSAGTPSDLTFSVSRDGEPVTSLQPYLGAYGHLVALRAGDLAYLHVHPEGEPADGTAAAGPAIGFVAEAPTAGAYLLYLDFKVDGAVHTATFRLEASGAAGTAEHARPEADQDHGH